MNNNQVYSAMINSSENLSTRRQFLENIVFASTGVALLSSFKSDCWQIGCFTRSWAQYDPGNIFFYSEGKIDTVDDSKEVNGLVTGMCVKDFLPSNNVDITPGTGKVNFSEVLSNLRRGRFKKGPLIVECLSLCDVAHVNSQALKARKFLEEITG